MVGAAAPRYAGRVRYRSLLLLLTFLGCSSTSEDTAAPSGTDPPPADADDSGTPVDAAVPAEDAGVISDASADADGKPTPPVLGPELLVNGGFENGTTGWINQGNSTVVASPHSGASAVRTGVGAGGFVQDVTVVPGQRYRLAAYHKAEPDNGGAVFRVIVDLPGGETKQYPLGLFASSYQRLTTDIEVPAGVTKVGVSFWKNAGTGNVYLDDVSFRTVVPSTPVAVLDDEGDSISVAGTHSSLYASGTADLSFVTHAVGGSGIAGVESRKDAVLARKPAAGPWVVTLLIGANDLAGADTAQYSGKLFAYADAMRGAGAKFALGTVLPQANNASHNTTRAALNEIIRDNVGVHIDAVIDYAADPVIGPDAAAKDLTLYSDGLHPTGSGQERMFQVYKPVVDKLLMKDP